MIPEPDLFDLGANSQPGSRQIDLETLIQERKHGMTDEDVTTMHAEWPGLTAMEIARRTRRTKFEIDRTVLKGNDQ